MRKLVSNRSPRHLYIIVMTCRRSDLRHEAFEILESRAFQEDIWPSSAMAAAVERITEEEAGWDRESSQQVPESCRAQGVLIHTDPLRKTVQGTYGWPSDTFGTPASKTLVTEGMIIDCIALVASHSKHI